MHITRTLAHAYTCGYYRGIKFLALIFVIFLDTRNYSSWTFRFPARCSKVLNLLYTLDMSRKENTFCIKEKSNKKYTTNSKIAWDPWKKNSLSLIMASKKYYWVFYKTSLTLLAGISVVAIFVIQLSKCSKIQKLLITIMLNHFYV